VRLNLWWTPYAVWLMCAISARRGSAAGVMLQRVNSPLDVRERAASWLKACISAGLRFLWGDALSADPERSFSPG
jgi:hypothetical protein